MALDARRGRCGIESADAGQAHHLHHGRVEPISRDQGFAFVTADEREASGIGERRRHVGVGQIRMARGVAQREILRNEFDVDHAAGGEFQIPRVLIALLARDQSAHFEGVAPKLFRIAFEPQNIADRLRRPGHEQRIAADHAGPCQCHMFPGFGAIALIFDEGPKLGRDRPLAAGRTQPHVDLVEPPAAGRDGERRNQPLRQAGVILQSMQRPGAFRFRPFFVEIIEQDEIEVGNRGHRARAEPAHRDDGAAAARHTAMIGGEDRLDMREAGAHQARGERRIGAPGCVRREYRRQRPHADEKRLFLRHVAYRIEKFLGAACRLQNMVAAPVVMGFVARRVERGRIDRGVEHVRTHSDNIGEARRAAENIAEQFAHGCIGLQNREQFDCGRHASERRVESGERRVGIAAAGESLQERRNELGQDFPGARALDGAATSEMPAAYGLGRLHGIAEAELAQGFDRFRIVGGAGEDQASGARHRARGHVRRAARNVSRRAANGR